MEFSMGNDRLSQRSDPEDNDVLMPWNDPTTISTKVDGQDRQLLRWKVITLQLDQPIPDLDTLISIIKSYNTDASPELKFRALKGLVESMTASECEEFFNPSGVLNTIRNLVLQSNTMFDGGIQWLKAGRHCQTKCHQLQLAALLALNFFCTLPKRPSGQPSVNFTGLFEGENRGDRRGRHVQKLRCIIEYFRRIKKQQLTGYVSFIRLFTPDNQYPRWDKVSTPLCDLAVHTDGKIEDQQEHLQADFANRYIGGGVLGWGCVQEEIRFVICPELIAARVFTEPFNDNEAMVIIGAERFSNYTGYADDFAYAGEYTDLTPCDDQDRRQTQIVAVDALRFPRPAEQYRERNLLRELKKMYTALKPIDGEVTLPFATGNWGCGAFRGDPQLKALLQLMACSQAGRRLVYFTFGNKELQEGLQDCYATLGQYGVKVGQLYRILARYARDRKAGQGVFSFVKSAIPIIVRSDSTAAEARLGRGNNSQPTGSQIPRSSSFESSQHRKRVDQEAGSSKDWPERWINQRPTIATKDFYNNPSNSANTFQPKKPTIPRNPRQPDTPPRERAPVVTNATEEATGDSQELIPGTPPDERYRNPIDRYLHERLSKLSKPEAGMKQVRTYEGKIPTKRKDIGPVWKPGVKKINDVCDNQGRTSLLDALEVEQAKQTSSTPKKAPVVFNWGQKMNANSSSDPQSSYHVENEKVTSNKQDLDDNCKIEWSSPEDEGKRRVIQDATGNFVDTKNAEMKRKRADEIADNLEEGEIAWDDLDGYVETSAYFQADQPDEPMDSEGVSRCNGNVESASKNVDAEEAASPYFQADQADEKIDSSASDKVETPGTPQPMTPASQKKLSQPTLHSFFHSKSNL